MIDIKRKILSIVEPSIVLKKIVRPASDVNLDSGQETTAPNYAKARTSVEEGGVFPLIMIKDSIISHKYLISFSLSMYNNIPEIVFTFEDIEGLFDIELPADGDTISLYLRPADLDNLKPIRIDFDIASALPTMTAPGEATIYNMKGIMKIPGFFNDVCKGFKPNTSFNHLLDVCESVNLGFASNETQTDDVMTRICPYTSLRTFVDDMVKSSYKNDNSFFKWFIDPYYYLCFVNVNKQLTTKIEPDVVNINKSYPTDGLYLEKDTDLPQSGKLILSTDKNLAGSNLYITNYSISGDQGTWINNGYIKKPIIYDIDTKNKNNEKIEYTIESLISENSEKDFILQKGKAGDDFYKSQVKYHWLGKQEGYSVGGNVHDSFIFSKVHNFQNNLELNKLNMEVEINGPNFYIQKYTMIPVEIYQMKEEDGHWKEKRIKERDNLLGDRDNVRDSTDINNEIKDETPGFDDRKQFLNKLG